MRKTIVILSASVAALLAGCKTGPKPPPATAPSLSQSESPVIGSTDPSAMKLHDLSGAMLMYYALNKRLPDSIDDLRPLADGDAGADALVPGTRTPYVYSANGIVLQDQSARVVLYEPAPLHDGFRLAVRIDEPKPDRPLIARVISLPESFFLLRPPAARTPAVP